MDDNREEQDCICPICFVTYNLKEFAPRVLSCGHTHCTRCLSRILKSGRKCGECRATVTYSNVQASPVNYAVLRILDDKKSPAAKKEKREFQECKELDSQIDGLIQDLDTKKEYYNTSIDRLNKKIKTVESKQESLRESKDLLISKNTAIRQSDSLQNIKSLLEDTLKIAQSTDQKLKDLDQIKFDMLEEKVLPYFELPSDFYVDFGGGVWADLKRGDLPDKLYIGQVKRSPSQPYPKKFRTSILASEFRSHYCGAHLVVRAGVSTFSVDIEVFRLPNGYLTNRGIQFLALCIGEYGPTLVGTKLFNHSRARREGESVQGGDYEHNNGKGGKPLIRGLDKIKISNKPITTGLVAGLKTPKTTFEIYLEGWPNKKTNLSFGRVVSGRSFLQKALKIGVTVVVVESYITVDFAKAIQPFGGAPSSSKSKHAAASADS